MLSACNLLVSQSSSSHVKHTLWNFLQSFSVKKGSALLLPVLLSFGFVFREYTCLFTLEIKHESNCLSFILCFAGISKWHICWAGNLNQISSLIPSQTGGRQVLSPLHHTTGGGGQLPYKRLMGMCRWMGSHFHDWIDYNVMGSHFQKLLEWGRTFSNFRGKTVLHITVSKRTRMFVQ